MRKMKKEKKKMGNIQRAVLYRTIIPILIMGIIIVIASVSLFEKQIEKEISNTLTTAGKMFILLYDKTYPGEYELRGKQKVSLFKGENELTDDYEIIDQLKSETGYDYTLFYKNTRIITTLCDENGMRYKATGLNTAPYNEVTENRKTVFSSVDVNGEKYYACYEPIINIEGEVICIVGVAVKQSVITKDSANASVPFIIISVACMALAGFIICAYTDKLTDSIKKIEKFLNGMIKGELNNEMPQEVTSREDELGNTAKSVVDMQNAIRILVERDPLTGIYNRRSGNARLRKIMAQCEKSGMPFSVVLGDIDFFKKVNDTYGHEAGDIVLKKVCEIMKKAMTGRGFVARWGGEEFLLIFSRDDSESAAVYMEEILNQIRKMEILYEGLTIKVTMTFGVAGGDINIEFAELLKKADDRLYYGKSNGRNRIVTKDEEIASGNTNESDSTINNNDNRNSEENKETSEKNHNNNDIKDNSNNSGEPKDNISKEEKMEYIEKEINNVIDDAFLEQLIEKMNEKLYNETLGEKNERKKDKK